MIWGFKNRVFWGTIRAARDPGLVLPHPVPSRSETGWDDKTEVVAGRDNISSLLHPVECMHAAELPHAVFYASS